MIEATLPTNSHEQELRNTSTSRRSTKKNNDYNFSRAFPILHFITSFCDAIFSNEEISISSAMTSVECHGFSLNLQAFHALGKMIKLSIGCRRKAEKFAKLLQI